MWTMIGEAQDPASIERIYTSGKDKYSLRVSRQRRKDSPTDVVFISCSKQGTFYWFNCSCPYELRQELARTLLDL